MPSTSYSMPRSIYCQGSFLNGAVFFSLMDVSVYLWVMANCPYCNAVEPRLTASLRKIGVELVTKNIEVPGADIMFPENVIIFDVESGGVIDRASVDVRELLATPILDVRVYGRYGDEYRILIPAVPRYIVEEGKRIYDFDRVIERYVENVTELIRELVSVRRPSRLVIRRSRSEPLHEASPHRHGVVPKVE